MMNARRITTAALLALTGATLVGVLQTGRSSRLPQGQAEPIPQMSADVSPVDQSPLKMAQQLALVATTPDERRLAQEALRVADHEVDLAFAEALRQAAEHPPVLSAEGRDIQARSQKAQEGLRDDQSRVAWYTREAAGVTGDRREEIEKQLELAKAQVELDRDDVDDAREDLIRIGGDPQDRIQRMVREHEGASHEIPGPQPGAAPAANELFGERGLVHQGRRWLVLHRQRNALLRAQQEAQATAARLSGQHESLETQVDSRGSADPEPVGAGLVSKTKRLSSDRKSLTALDRRIGDQKELAGIYGRWSDIVAARQREAIYAGLLGVLLILLIAMVGQFSDTWLERWLGRVALERRRVEQLRTLTRVTVRVVGVLLVLLVVIGPPSQLATVLGLAGAGLTVALKDFIVGFIGWFVLMGRNGIRLGDWVEINGVSGEVVELGPFHTVLLETGNWAASGHPTGRRVTFPNSFAIEGHYFNFSTSGQWLWDELQVYLPSSQDPYPIVEAISAMVLKETQANARLAEQEWQRVAQSKELKGFSAEPAVSVRPVSSGVEVLVRYMTRASERQRVRSRLYQSAVELLGRRTIPPPPAPFAPQPSARDSH